MSASEAPTNGETRPGAPIQSAALRIGSLCTGIGGLDLAAEAHFGADLAWYSELEPAPCVVLERTYPGVVNHGDLTVINWAGLEPIDILTAGYPCQPFSHAGKRKGASDVRHLWPYVAEAVRVLRPRWVVLENVAGHLTLGFGDVLRDLAEAGFDAEWGVLRASDVGAPHQRARVWIVATDSHGEGLEGSEPAPGHELPPGCGDPAPHSRHDRRHRCEEQHSTPSSGLDRSSWGHADRRGMEATRVTGMGEGERGWGPYAPAIRRWTQVVGRPAPDPTDDKGRLNPSFVEWMMGYPEGWVDGLNRTKALKALGNAVVPQQALAALRELEPRAAKAAA